jgi:Putative transposase of IS4/5 family (DUF4096)
VRKGQQPPWIVPDELWERIEPLLPVVPRRADHPGRKRLDNRKVLSGILFVLYTGIPWEFLPQELGSGSGMTCWRRLRDWHEAGVWQRPPLRRSRPLRHRYRSPQPPKAPCGIRQPRARHLNSAEHPDHAATLFREGTTQQCLLQGYASILHQLCFEAGSGRLRISARRLRSRSEPLLLCSRADLEDTWGCARAADAAELAQANLSGAG